MNSILIIVLRFCLVAYFSARQEVHFQKIVCPKRIFPSEFVKLGSEILYLFSAEKIVVCCLFVYCNTLSDFGLLLTSFFLMKNKECFISWCW